MLCLGGRFIAWGAVFCLVGFVDAVAVVLPERVVKVLRGRLESEGRTIEEFVGEAVLEKLDIVDPDVRVEFHLKLCEKYLRECEDFLAKGDYVQASEKAWGAAAQAVKALAAKEGRVLRSHASLWEYVDKLAERLRDVELRHEWGRANNLHQNFYENWMPPREVEFAVRDVKRFVKKLVELVKGSL